MRLVEGVAAETSEAVALLAGLLSLRIEEAPFLPFPLKSLPFVQICLQVPKQHIAACERFKMVCQMAADAPPSA